MTRSGGRRIDRSAPRRTGFSAIAGTLILIGCVFGGCVSPEMIASPATRETQLPFFVDPVTGDANPTPDLVRSTRERREVVIVSGGVTLAGELDLPRGEAAAPLVFVIHHSGPVARDAYGYMAELLTQAGFAVFRFDKRGVGKSAGDYGCCEADDAVAAYRTAVAQAGIDRQRVFIVAQSVGTEYLAGRFDDFASAQPPAGVVLLSSLLGPERIVSIAAPVHVIVSDSEGNLELVSRQAVAAHAQARPYGASDYVAEQSEHTLFDITDGPIDWSDPNWVKRYHRGAMDNMIEWLQQITEQLKGNPE